MQLPPEQHQELLEKARYESYRVPGANARWVRRYLLLALACILFSGLFGYLNSLTQQLPFVVSQSIAGVFTVATALFFWSRWSVDAISAKVALLVDQRLNRSKDLL